MLFKKGVCPKTPYWELKNISLQEPHFPSVGLFVSWVCQNAMFCWASRSVRCLVSPGKGWKKCVFSPWEIRYFNISAAQDSVLQFQLCAHRCFLHWGCEWSMPWLVLRGDHLWQAVAGPACQTQTGICVFLSVFLSFCPSFFPQSPIWHS